MEIVMNQIMMGAAAQLMTGLVVFGGAACLLLTAAWAVAGITKPCR